MSNDKAKNFEIEKVFTRQDYKEFIRAVNDRESYNFFYGKEGTYHAHPTTNILIAIRGYKCDNGVWKDNYLYAIDGWRDNGGFGFPFDPIDELLSYEQLVNILYNGLHLQPPAQKQITLFDMEM